MLTSSIHSSNASYSPIATTSEAAATATTGQDGAQDDQSLTPA